MTEIIDRPASHTVTPYRSTETQQRYDEHRAHKHAIGDYSCDMCRLVREQNEQKIGGSAVDFVSKGVSLFSNDYGYDKYSISEDNRIHLKEGAGGFEVIKHDLLVPDEHYAELIDFPPHIMKAFTETWQKAMTIYSGCFLHTPQDSGSSIKDHAHLHLYIKGRPIVERHYSTEDRVNLVRFAGDPPFDEL